ncbi:MAG: RNA polymerase sigma factor [Bacillota bacterium]
MSLSDEVLVEMCKQGDLAAFEQLVEKHQSRVYTIAYRYMGNYADASDLAQEAFIKIYRSLGSYRGEASFQSWMYRLVTNACMDELRRRGRAKTVSIEELMENKKGLTMSRVTTKSRLPEDAVIRRELQREVQNVLNTLSDEHRAIVVMRDIQGYSYEEIAELLQCSLGTVKSRLNRARHVLKEKLLARREMLVTGTGYGR